MFLIGASMWAFGLAINIHSDYILCNLRKPGETGYKIPMGGAFNYVSGKYTILMSLNDRIAFGSKILLLLPSFTSLRGSQKHVPLMF